MTHAAVRQARREGFAALFAAAPDLSRIVWISEPAAAIARTEAGPQDAGARELAAHLKAALPSDGSEPSELVVTIRDIVFCFRLSRQALTEDGPEFLLLATHPLEAVEPSREGLRFLAEIGQAPIAVWHSSGAWFDAGFNDVWQIYSEDLQDMRDGSAIYSDGFLGDGEPIGLAKLSGTALAVWHLKNNGIGALDFSPRAPAEVTSRPTEAIEAQTAPRKPPLRSPWGAVPAVSEPVPAAPVEAPAAAADGSPDEEPTDMRAVRRDDFGGAPEDADPPSVEPEVMPLEPSRGTDDEISSEASLPGEPDTSDILAGPAEETPPETRGTRENSGAAASDEALQTPPAEPTKSPEPAEDPAAFVPPVDGAPIRFVWRIGHDGAFQSVSHEFAEAVGPRAADIVGCSFATLASAFWLDPDGEIAALLAGRDTWSGRSVQWPVEGTSHTIPVDLAALPIYARDRSFDGFRGFGVARPGEPSEDPDAAGIRLAKGETIAAIAEANLAAERSGDRLGPRRGLQFGRRAPEDRPGKNARDGKEAASADGVIQLSERRRQRETPLSAEENDAFRVIGEALSSSDERSGLEQAIRSARERIAALNQEDGRDHGLSEGSDDGADWSESDAVPGTSPAATPDLVPTLMAAYERLPIPLIAQSGDALIYANAEFRDLTGYKDSGELSALGGLNHLFADNEQGKSIQLRRANGDIIALRAQMNRVTFAGRSCLVIAFFATPRMTLAALQADVAPRGAASEPVNIVERLDRLNAALTGASEAVVLIDAERRIDIMNGRAARLFGFAAVDINGRNEAGGRPFASLFAHESQRAVLSLMKGDTDSVIDEGRDLVGRRADGLFLSLTVLIEALEGGGWCAIMRAQSGTRPADADSEALRAAEIASQRKTEFLAGVAHEIRTPMNAILGFADAISSEAFGPIGNRRYLDYLGDIKRSGAHVLDLVNDLLDISKAEAGRLDLDFSPVALNEVAGEVIAMMQPAAGSARVVLRSNLPASVPPVVADERTTRQIVANLVQNAINFTPAGGQVIVSTQYRADGSVALRCRDSGVGMSDEEIQLALTPYTQLAAKGDGAKGGTGLGLPLARTMAEANRAELTITSQPQAGTLVELVFPKDRVLND